MLRVLVLLVMPLSACFTRRARRDAHAQDEWSACCVRLYNDRT